MRRTETAEGRSVRLLRVGEQVRHVLSELLARGHDVRVLEPKGSWSLANLLKDHGEEGLAAFRNAYPELSSRTYSRPEEGAAQAWGADLVIVHEWNDPELVAAVGRLRTRVTKLDTHFRQAQEDVAAITTSTEKIARRGDKIEQIDFVEAGADVARLVSPRLAAAE